MQIFFPGTNPPLPPLSELAVMHRVAPSRRPGRRRPLGELPHRPSRPRVRSLLHVSWGRRRRRAIDRDLIERSSASRTPLVFCLADSQAPPVNPFRIRLPRALLDWAGRRLSGPDPFRSGPPFIFFRKSYWHFLGSVNFENS
jgi:hypothetical protein